MANKIKPLKITEAQLNSIIELASDISAMVGERDEETDKIWKRHVKNIDKLLLNNGYKRQYQ